MDNISYKIIPALESHIPFIYNSFLRSYSGTFPVKYLDNSVYYPKYHDIVELAIDALGVSVACNPDEPDHLLGYIVGNSAEILYVYVKQDYRGLGIATDLVKHTLTGEQGHIQGPTAYKLLTRSGMGLLRYLSKYVLQDADFYYQLPTEVKRSADKKSKGRMDVRRSGVRQSRESPQGVLGVSGEEAQQEGQVAAAVGMIS